MIFYSLNFSSLSYLFIYFIFYETVIRALSALQKHNEQKDDQQCM